MSQSRCWVAKGACLHRPTSGKPTLPAKLVGIYKMAQNSPNNNNTPSPSSPPPATSGTLAHQAAVQKLFQEAQRRSSQPQPAIKHRRPKSLLLMAPNNIIFELFNTVIKQTPPEVLLDFVSKNLKSYLEVNWSTKITQQSLRRLRREQAVDVRAGLTEAPAIRCGTGVKTAKPITTIVDVKSTIARVQSSLQPQQQQQRQQQQQMTVKSPQAPMQQQQPPALRSNIGASPPQQQPTVSNSNDARQRSPPIAHAYRDKQAAIESIFEHIMWRIQTDNVTQITSLIIKLVVDDGYKRGKLKADAYAEVFDCFQDWRARKLIKLYAFGSAPANDQKLILANTNSGDIARWVANFIDGTEKRQKPEMIRILATALRDKTKNCIYITHELIDAMNSIETGAIRCAFLVDRLSHYDPITSMPHYSSQIEPLILSGKLYVMSSLDCVEFAPDPTSPACC